MKGNYILGLIAMAAFALVSCDMLDDEISIRGNKPQKQITKSFNETYPDARDVEWEFENGCWVVSYETGWGSDKVEYESWYDAEGNWIMTKREIRISAVPQHIKDSLAADPEYGSSRLEDNEVEHYDVPTVDFYRFDIIHNGREMEIDVTESGEVTPAKR